jgi:CBS domain containing-hemolysin-like protein
MPLVLLCVLIQGFFSGSEMALVNASHGHLESLSARGNRGAKLALQLREHDENLLGTCLVGTNLALTTGSTLTLWLLLESGTAGEFAATAVFLPLTLVLGEALPKTLCQTHADTLASVVAWPLSQAQRLFSPALWVATRWKRALNQLSAAPEERIVRREDIVGLLDDDGYAIDAEERQLVRNIIAMTETPVEECMTPLVDVHAVSEDATVEEAVAVVLHHGHSRLPVFRDRVDNIVGVIDHRDLLFGTEPNQEVRTIAKPVSFVPEQKRVDQLLRELRAEGEQFVVVVDEYGGSIGVVTIEDLLEEIVGEIRDERDEDEPTLRQIGEGEWRVSARVELDEFCEAVDREMPDGNFDTVAGLLLARLGHIPEPGETVDISGLRFVIEKATDRAIEQVGVRISPDA